ncbi:MAG: iron donor protein CyaY [Rhodospirillales bacterium]|nr:iron donor protein CyaY [Rhodospirillales bacterium]
MSLDESSFESIAGETLDRFMDVIDDVLGGDLDVDLEGGILNIELEAGGQYVINKHAPNRQIWLSSPFSGASHYEYDEAAGDWLSTRGGASLTALLEGELEKATGKTVSLA